MAKKDQNEETTQNEQAFPIEAVALSFIPHMNLQPDSILLVQSPEELQNLSNWITTDRTAIEFTKALKEEEAKAAVVSDELTENDLDQ